MCGVALDCCTHIFLVGFRLDLRFVRVGSCLDDIKHSRLFGWVSVRVANLTACKTARRSRLPNVSCRCGRCGHPVLPPVGVNQKGPWGPGGRCQS